MPQRDLYHENVKNALIKDGWTITDDPFRIQYKGDTLFADLGAEKTIAAQLGTRKIVVEIKMFNAPSLYTEFERALGQYILYRTLMAVVYPNHELFLGVPEDIQADFFKREAVRLTLTAQRINVLVFNPEQEVITQWIQS